VNVICHAADLIKDTFFSADDSADVGVQAVCDFGCNVRVTMLG
jgi:hypothetical protein